MNLPLFILLHLAFIMVDGLVTLSMFTALPGSIFLARLFGVTAGYIFLAVAIHYVARTHTAGKTLAIVISFISACVSFGLFALILTRNPMIQWPVAFAAGSIAALALAALGYIRATRVAGKSL